MYLLGRYRDTPMRTHALVIALLLLPAVAGIGAASDSTAIDELEGYHLWEGEDRVVDHDLRLAPGATLHVRGINVTFGEGVTVIAAPTAKLFVESIAGAPAILTGSSLEGWEGMISGEMILRGLPAAPVIVEHLAGRSGAMSTGVFAEGGLVVSGNDSSLYAEHAIFQKYRTAITSGSNASIFFDHVTFASNTGHALIATQTHLTIANSTFRGLGADVYTSVSRSEQVIKDTTFNHTRHSLTIHGSLGGALIENVVVENAADCLAVTGFSRGTSLKNFTCLNYANKGIYVRPEHTAKATVSMDGFLIASSNRNATEAVSGEPRALTLRNGAVGPLPSSNGIVVAHAVPTIENVEFSGVGGFNVFVIEPPSAVPRTPFGSGDPGQEGWLLVTSTLTVKVVQPDQEPAARASVEARAAGREGRMTSSTNLVGITSLSNLEVFRILPDGSVRDAIYVIKATSQDRTLSAQADHSPEDGDLLLVLSRPSRDPIPGPSALLVLMASCLVFQLGLRSRR